VAGTWKRSASCGIITLERIGLRIINNVGTSLTSMSFVACCLCLFDCQRPKVSASSMIVEHTDGARRDC
jgi:hypothetical protein